MELYGSSLTATDQPTVTRNVMRRHSAAARSAQHNTAAAASFAPPDPADRRPGPVPFY